MSVSIPRSLFDQVEVLARRLDMSESILVEHAIQNFIYEHLVANEQPHSSGEAIQTAAQMEQTGRVIHQGGIYWVASKNPGTLKQTAPHPYVVVQDDILNRSRIDSVVACALTSNIRRASDIPGNVLLELGEANLPRQSVVEVSKVTAIQKTELGEYIGSLTGKHIHQILSGIRLVQRFFDR